MTSKMNRLGTAGNRWQGDFKRVLCVCSAEDRTFFRLFLRSPTAALVLSQPPFNFNTRACGLDPDYALIIVDDVLLEWAQEIVCMSDEQAEELKKLTDKPIVVLDIEDSYAYREPALVSRVAEMYRQKTGFIP